MVYGNKTTCKLQELSTSIGDGMDVSNSWTTIKTFKGVFQSVTRSERQADGKDTAFGKYILFIDYNALTSSERAKLIEPNRIQIASDNYNIIGVEKHDLIGNHHYEVYLRIIDAE